MNRINFNGKDGGGFHHLTPYQKKSRRRPRPIPEVVVKQENPEKEIMLKLRRRLVIHSDYDILAKPLKQVEKILTTIEIINNPTGYTHTKGFFNYHSHSTFKRGNEELSVTDSIGGCGMQQFYGWLSINKYDTAVDLIDCYLHNKRHGVGLVICQLGQDYFGGPFEKALIHYEFKVSEEYSNFQHGTDGKYKQRIYSLQVKKKYD